MFDQILRHTSAYGDIYELKKNVHRITVLNYEIMPLILPLEIKSKKAFCKFMPGENLENINLEISKDDLMFQFWLHHSGTIDNALEDYFSSGYKQAVIINDILKSNFTDIANINILDFASGHGRISRYFKLFLPIANITIAEIKLGAVDFQKNIFGYEGFVSFPNPAQLTSDEKFDYILVSSLFTHLNKELFSLWLGKLGSMLTDHGILSLSLHIDNSIEKMIFNYSEKSEEDMFIETSGNIAGLNIYGLTYLNNIQFIQLVVANLGINYKIIDERPWGESQVLMSIQKKQN